MNAYSTRRLAPETLAHLFRRSHGHQNEWETTKLGWRHLDKTKPETLVKGKNTAHVRTRLEQLSPCAATKASPHSITDFIHRFSVLVARVTINHRRVRNSHSWKLAALVRVSEWFPAASRRDNTEDTAEDAMAPQTKRNWITWMHVDLFSSCRCLKQASVCRCCAARTSCEWWIHETSNNLLRYHCGWVCSVLIGAHVHCWRWHKCTTENVTRFEHCWLGALSITKRLDASKLGALGRACLRTRNKVQRRLRLCYSIISSLVLCCIIFDIASG